MTTGIPWPTRPLPVTPLLLHTWEWEIERRLEEVGEFARRTLAEFARCIEHRLREARAATLKRELAASARAAARDMDASFAAALAAGGPGAAASVVPTPRQFRNRALSHGPVLFSKVHSWELLSDSEPFVVYVIRSTLGREVSVVCKRFKHFKVCRLNRLFLPHTHIFKGRDTR